MFFYGIHACYHALLNRDRSIQEIYVVDEGKMASLQISKNSPLRKRVHVVASSLLKKMLPDGAVHQGVAVKLAPLPMKGVYDVDWCDRSVVVALDQVSDPHNVGAILRSCAAFGVSALIMTKAHAPKESGVMAKAASGALEYVPLCYVSNLSATFSILKDMGFWVYGFSEAGKESLNVVSFHKKSLFVFGSEGGGMRPLTEKNCDISIRLLTESSFSTLNVSNAVAVSLYEVFRQK